MLHVGPAQHQGQFRLRRLHMFGTAFIHVVHDPRAASVGERLHAAFETLPGVGHSPQFEAHRLDLPPQKLDRIGFEFTTFAVGLMKPEPDYQEALRRFGREGVVERHDKLETMLGDDPWLAGDRHTLADGLLAGVGTLAGVSRGGRHRALAQAAGTPSKGAIEDGETPAGTGAWKGQVPLADVINRFGRDPSM